MQRTNFCTCSSRLKPILNFWHRLWKFARQSVITSSNEERSLRSLFHRLCCWVVWELNTRVKRYSRNGKDPGFASFRRADFSSGQPRLLSKTKRVSGSSICFMNANYPRGQLDHRFQLDRKITWRTVVTAFIDLLCLVKWSCKKSRATGPSMIPGSNAGSKNVFVYQLQLKRLRNRTYL